jgi:hypothetical protein
MPSDGRIEKRIPMETPLYLVSLKKPRTAERVLTENVSAHGARVVTQRRWQSGEDHWIVPLSGQFQLPAQVIYCQPLADGEFRVGLDFRGCPVNWEADGGYVTPLIETGDVRRSNQLRCINGKEKIFSPQ